MYDGQMPVEETEYSSGQAGSFTTVRRNALGARGIDRIETVTSQGTGVAYPVYDGHGNMVATLSKQGTGYQIGNRRSFGAWGDVRQGAASGDPKGGYVANLGHVDDDESGLTYMRARYYEASSGRFTSEDKARDGLNCFVYCSNQPATRIDSSGYSDESDADFFKYLGWVAGVEGLAQVIAGAFVSTAARGVAIAGLLWMVVWFGTNFRDYNGMASGPAPHRAITGLLGLATYAVLGKAFDPAMAAGSASPAINAVAVCMVYSGIIMAFLGLETVASGY